MTTKPIVRQQMSDAAAQTIAEILTPLSKPLETPRAPFGRDRFTLDAGQVQMDPEDWALAATTSVLSIPIGADEATLTRHVSDLFGIIEQAPDQGRAALTAVLSDVRHPGWLRLLAALATDDATAVTDLARHTTTLAGKRIANVGPALLAETTAWKGLSPLRRARLVCERRLLSRPLTPGEFAETVGLLAQATWFIPRDAGRLIAWWPTSRAADLNHIVAAIQAANLPARQAAEIVVHLVNDSQTLVGPARRATLDILREALAPLAVTDLASMPRLNFNLDASVALLAGTEQDRRVAALAVHPAGSEKNTPTPAQRLLILPAMAAHPETVHLLVKMVPASLPYREGRRPEQQVAMAAFTALANADTRGHDPRQVEHWAAEIVNRARLGLADLSVLHATGRFGHIVASAAARHLCEFYDRGSILIGVREEHASQGLLDSVAALPQNGLTLPALGDEEPRWLVDRDDVEHALIVMAHQWGDGPAMYTPSRPLPGTRMGLNGALVTSLRDWARQAARHPDSAVLQDQRDQLTRWLANISAAAFRDVLQDWVGAQSRTTRQVVTPAELPAPLWLVVLAGVNAATHSRARETLIGLLATRAHHAVMPDRQNLEGFARSLNQAALRGALTARS